MQRYGQVYPSPPPTISAAYAVAAALANPYSAHSFQRQTTGPATTPDGYTISSAFTPSFNSPSVTSEPSRVPEANTRQRTQSWYQPGNNKCSYPGCNFSGSHKTLEIHKMDRHLIYPPNWDKRKPKSDWDADPSLKGKPVPIQGTSLVLDSPEALDAWIAERKRRWPTAHRVQEKKLKMEEAIARGQLSPEDSGSHRRKRQKLSESDVRHTGGGYDRGYPSAARRANANTQRDRGWNGQRTATTVHNDPATFNNATVPSSSSAEADVDDDRPEVISSKLEPPAQEPLPPIPQPNIHPSGAPDGSRQIQRPYTQPRKAPPNPFASRPALLRNLLLPEIRVTVSNLSQAIRFLADNDFLRDVEMKAGEAEDNMIQVISGSGDV